MNSLAQLRRLLACCLLTAFSALIVTGLATAAIAQTPPQPKGSPQPGPAARVTIGFVEIEGDPRHEPIRAYERLILKTREHPFAGAQVAVEEARPLTRVLQAEFALERITVKSAEAVAPAVRQAIEAHNIHFFVLDAPAE